MLLHAIKCAGYSPPELCCVTPEVLPVLASQLPRSLGFGLHKRVEKEKEEEGS